MPRTKGQIERLADLRHALRALTEFERRWQDKQPETKEEGALLEEMRRLHLERAEEVLAYERALEGSP